jgi:hypothetical protein
MNETEEFDKVLAKTISARNFHFDHFNKWMTYYYVAVAAIFVGYTSTFSNNKETAITLALLGFFISVLWHLSCKGYYFWIKNWTYQINRLEKEISDNKKVFSVFSTQVLEKNDNLISPVESANVSTSKVTLLLSFFVSNAWIYLFLASTNTCCVKCHHMIYMYVFSSLAITCLSIYLLGLFVKSDIKGHTLN